MSYLLAIDQGTTSTRCVVYDQQLNIVNSAQQEYPLIYPEDGWVEVNPSELLASVYQTLDPMLDLSLEIVCAGITNQRETTLVWDVHSGEPVFNGIVWQDRRTAAHCNALKDQSLESVIQAKTGLLLDPYFSASKISWILNNVEGVRARAQAGNLRFGTVDSFLLWHLSGGTLHKTDVTNASRTSLFNINTLEWDDELLEIFDVPLSMLPEVCSSDADFGSFCRMNQTIPITGMIGDQQSALVGQRCFDSGDMKATFGTGCFLMVNSGLKPQSSQSGLLSTVGYQLSDDIHYALEGSIFSAGTIIQWLRDNMQFFEDSNSSIELLSHTGQSNGVLFIPAFTGIGAPHWNAEVRAAFYGITRDTSQQDMVTAAFKSLIYQVIDIKDALQEDGINIQSLAVDGGMVTNEKFCQLLADFLELDIHVPASTESSAIGAAITAGIGHGLFSSKRELKQASRHLTVYTPRDGIRDAKDFERWREFLQLLMQIYK
ncbi:MAG: glycerol kinase [SAR86 cluster bacterium BACL1 MAG-120920-bin57]|jgi:glycerol kinase|uniref:ATP:glycerol 3-phosphotransferase n=1 Tax=SAR86 cluster bacterium BACL1 MAG-120920-bin57 TaxID=1655571 RepID=A0A0R2PXI1_9GAMM|nr:MAG: glycerol kinase [SAR86 cluster bacterium BACL1 MAG-120920-bin57]KRO97947.1 MAG: glycerol kinase [SAR86 cluster bacterium BACL1 MAG-120813-bin36]